MSRIGKKEIIVPSNLKVEISDSIKVSNGKHSLETEIPSEIKLKYENNKITLTRNSEENRVKSLHGLVRNLIANMVNGFQKPFQKVLQIKGIGFKANVAGKKLVLNVGYSHPVEIDIIDGINISIDAKTNQLTVEGFDKLKVGEIAATIRAIRPPEPYKGTGIMYLGEKIIRKAGKSAASSKK